MHTKYKTFNKKKVVIALNSSWNLYNFRSGLISSLLRSGFEVIGVAPEDDYTPKVKALGCRFIKVKMSPKGINPLQDMGLLFQYYKIFRHEKPDVFLGFTIKPNIYGSIVAHLLKIPVINNIAGLGIVFQKNNWLTKLVLFLYSLALCKSRSVFFQNKEDQLIFLKKFKFLNSKCDVLPGSGVDLKKFSPVPLKNKKNLHCLMIARLLWDKGVLEFVEAAKILSKSYPDLDFLLLGYLESQDKSYVSYKLLKEWSKDGLIKYLGSSDDVRNHIAEADCIVLPSYYPEGTPRVLLEAAAMARPIITTNTKGCRNVVDDGLNGFLCIPKDSVDLAEKIIRMFELDYDARRKMGELGRKKIEQEFDEAIVCSKYFREISSLF